MRLTVTGARVSMFVWADAIDSGVQRQGPRLS